MAEVSNGLLVTLLSGATSGLAADIFTHPIDTMRARQQFERGGFGKYDTMWSTTRSIVSREGPLALYKGFGSVALFTAPAHAMYFGGYEFAKKFLNPAGATAREQSPFSHFAAGLFADLCGSLLWCPQDVIKQKLQVQENEKGAKGRYHNSLHGLEAVYTEEGLAGLYRGFLASLMVYGPMVGLHFMVYERLKLRAARWAGVSKVEDLPAPYYLGSAMFSASYAAFVTTPLDVVKTRLQVQSVAEGGYSGIWDGLKSIWRTEGHRAFFKGSVARAMWLGPNAAIAMFFYELARKEFVKVAPQHKHDSAYSRSDL